MTDQPADPPGLDAAVEAARQRVRTIVGLDDDDTFADAVIRHAVRAAAPALSAGAQREAADAEDACQRCGKAHQLRPVPNQPKLYGTWADPDDGHAYVRTGTEEAAQRLRERADRIGGAT